MKLAIDNMDIQKYWPNYARWRKNVKLEYKHYLHWCEANGVPDEARLSFDQYAQKDLFKG